MEKYIKKNNWRLLRFAFN